MNDELKRHLPLTCITDGPWDAIISGKIWNDRQLVIGDMKRGLGQTVVDIVNEHEALVQERDAIHTRLEKIEWLVTHCGFEIVADNRAQGGFLLRGHGVIYSPVEAE